MSFCSYCIFVVCCRFLLAVSCSLTAVFVTNCSFFFHSDLQVVVYMCAVICFTVLLYFFAFLLPILFVWFLWFKISVLVSQFARACFAFCWCYLTNMCNNIFAVNVDHPCDPNLPETPLHLSSLLTAVIRADFVIFLPLPCTQKHPPTLSFLSLLSCFAMILCTYALLHPSASIVSHMYPFTPLYIDHA